MKAIFFIAAICLWDGALSFPDHGLKDRKQHKTVSNVALQNDVEGYFFLDNPEKSIQDGYDIPVTKEIENVEIFGGARPALLFHRMFLFQPMYLPVHHVTGRKWAP